MVQKTSRRQFITGGLTALLSLGTNKLFNIFPEARAYAANGARQVSIPKQLEAGRMLNSFLILPEKAQIPAFVQLMSQPAPAVCGVGLSEKEMSRIDLGYGQSLKSVSELSDLIDFEFYTWDDQIDAELHLDTPTIHRYANGELYSISLTISAKVFIEELNQKIWITVVNLYATPNYPNPPVLYESETPNLSFQPTTINQKQLVYTELLDEFDFHWIEQGILFRLITTEIFSFEESRQMIELLRSVGG